MSGSDRLAAENYAYWRQHGGEWGQEYRVRKTYLLYYHVQELMLADYFAHSTPASVLEFGCGTGRHMRYLKDLPGLEVHGHDQSPSMVSNILDWADQAWFDQHITLGEPVGRLPFPDDHFDIVFTSEVLVHVRPEDLESILKELVRVSKWQVLHIEPSPSAALVSDEHGGCWNHDLIAAYARLGYECEQLESGFGVQAPYRVILSIDREPYRWEPALIALWRQMLDDLQPGFDQIPALKSSNQQLLEELSRIGDVQQELASTSARLTAREADLASQRTYLADLERDLISSDSLLAKVEAELLEEHRRAETYSSRLYVIQSSISFRVIEKLRLSPAGRPIAKLLRVVIKGMRPIARGLSRVLRAVRRPGKQPVVIERTPIPPGHMRLSSRSEQRDERVGSDIWLLAVERPGGTEPFDLKTVVATGRFELRTAASTPSGSALVMEGTEAWADLPASTGDEIVLLRHPWSGIAVLEWQGTSVEVNLHGPDGRVRCILGQSAIDVDIETDRDVVGGEPYHYWSASRLRKEELAWLEEYSRDPQPLSVGHPDWRGIRSSASQLFDRLFFLEDELDEASGRRYARLFDEAGCPALVIQGFPQTYQHLVLAMRKLAPSVPVYVIWHGNFLQAREDYAWSSFRTVADFARDGFVKKVGFVKKGMAELLAEQGLNTGFVMNLVRTIPTGPSEPLPGGPHLGIWNIVERWHRPPFAMIAAASMVRGGVLHISGTSARVHQTLDFWHLERRLHTKAIAQADMPSFLAQMHLNLNVTLSECAPMLPLESLSLGVPCLLGPTSHYFDDDDYLRSRLVVPSPDSASTIGELARQAIDERAEIIEAYRLYAPGYNERALDALERFLEVPIKSNI